MVPIKRFNEQSQCYERANVLTKQMSNYVSLGVDARIGLGFDENRSKNATKNKCVYFCEGIKQCFVRNPKVKYAVESLEQLHLLDQQNNNEQELDINIKDMRKNSTYLFTTTSAKQALKANTSPIKDEE